MDIKKFFNIALLAISLSTIFITLISYIVFKLRQAVINKNVGEKNRIDGSFFRRYAPKLEAENEKEISEFLNKNKSKISIKAKTMWIGGFVFVVILTVFLFEDYFMYRKQINERVKSAGDYRALIKKGLLKSYEFNPDYKETMFEVAKNRTFIDQQQYLISELQKKQFCLLSTQRALKFNNDFHSLAKEAWIGFFKRRALKYKVISSISKKNDNSCLFIIPHTKSLSEKEFDIISKLKSPLFITGSFGTLNGLGEKKENSYLKNFFMGDVRESKQVESIIVSTKGRFLWEIPAGQMINLSSLDQTFSYVLDETSSLMAGNYNGIPLMAKDGNKNYYFSKIQLNGKNIWSSLDPLINEKQDYVDHIFMHLLARIGGVGVFKVSDSDSADIGKNTVISFDVNNFVDPIDPFLAVLKENDLKAVLQLTPAHLKTIWPSLKKYSNIEVSIKTLEDDRLFERDLRGHFEYFDQSRLDMEEIFGRKIMGVLPFKELVNPKLMNAIQQNRLSYLFGGKKILARAPVLLGDLDFFYFPRLDDTADDLLNNTRLVNASDFSTKYASIHFVNELLGGHSFLSFSSNSFNHKILQRGFIEYIEKNKIRTITFKEIIAWKRKREKIKLEKITNTEIFITNENNMTLNDIEISISVKNKIKKLKIPKIMAKETIELKIQ